METITLHEDGEMVVLLESEYGSRTLVVRLRKDHSIGFRAVAYQHTFEVSPEDGAAIKLDGEDAVVMFKSVSQDIPREAPENTT